MESDLLIRRWWRAGSTLLPPILLLALSSPVGAQTTTTIEAVEVYALGQDPLPTAATAELSGDDVVLRATLRFGNDCLARTGFDPVYRDLAPLALTGTRLVLLRARRATDGCPDMFAPVERSVVMGLPQAREVRQLVLADEIAGRNPGVVTVAPSGSTDPAGMPARSAGTLPALATATVTAGLDLRMRVALPMGCAPRDVAIEIIEGRSVTRSGQPVTLIPLWILVLADRPSCQSAALGRMVDLQASLRSLVLQGRELWLVNALTTDGSAPRLFTRLGPG